ncbi:DUF3489 domain-containing protein [Aliiroseovarius sp. xm-g-7]|uniref:DUF3489 domain-containing protein n=1 Tax=Aliiroseovarius sp. xm-g-7 TaxID=2651826 RepID=UPI0015683293|nr:DUF3489 domain-containing protein [Aliiroseovarius sp. xm-g-7]NRQ25991.1 hypothetical protein [Aliiroseovarius sp. xm-g-7]
MPKLTDTQSIILCRAATRPDNLAMPLPEGLAGAAAKMAVAKMVERGWLEEVEANLRRGEPLWRESGDGHGTTLIATEAGLAAIGIEPLVAHTVSSLRKVRSAAEAAKGNDGDATRGTRRSGTKQAQVIALLERPEGASLTEICAATGWQAHSARGVLSGGLKKKLGLPITAQKVAGRGTVYKLEAA